ncbi:unnamed protein product [Bursaphelenchus xylophilus]|uniref:(pine wood nematode) hypothetical protein n=1 Tax=Bursaphelenchus xylophilus TaxID=6326 RepID=A0A1I7RY82_BURXY|nr:unnamed protein product [Bursaphelenchus xylophilus]CAG9085424.1 unnamed protein product [Bursaphelenchus xylophilus]
MAASTMKEYIDKQLEKSPADEITELLLDNIQSTKLSGLEGHNFANLNHLSLIGCGLQSFEGLPCIPSVKVVDASENKISDLSPLVEKCPSLYHLNLCGNNIEKIEQLKPLAELKNLQVLDVFDCPLAEEEDYRDKIFATIPSLQYLDGFDVNNEELEDLEEFGGEDAEEHDHEDLDDEEEEEEDEAEEVGLDYLNSSSALKDDDSEDYIAEKKNGLKRKADAEAGDDVPLKK